MNTKELKTTIHTISDDTTKFEARITVELAGKKSGLKKWAIVFSKIGDSEHMTWINKI